MDRSEFSLAPTRILIHGPRDGAATAAMDRQRLEDFNFLALPRHDELGREYGEFRSALAEQVEVTSLKDVLEHIQTSPLRQIPTPT